MVITDTRIREALRSDMKAYAETEQFLLEQLGTDASAQGRKNMNISIATDRRASGRNGRVLMAGIMVLAAIAVIAVILFKLLPALRSPVANEPGPESGGSNILVTGETEDANDMNSTDEASENAETSGEADRQDSIFVGEDGSTYWTEYFSFTLPELWRNPDVKVNGKEDGSDAELSVTYRGLKLCEFFVGQKKRFVNENGGDPGYYKAGSWDLEDGQCVAMYLSNWAWIICNQNAIPKIEFENLSRVEYTSDEDLSDILHMVTGKDLDAAKVRGKNADASASDDVSEVMDASHDFITHELIPGVSIGCQFTGYFYWYLTPAGSQVGMMLYCPEEQAPEERFLDLLVPEEDQDDGLLQKYADLSGGTKIRAFLSDAEQIPAGEGESYLSGTIVDLIILEQDTKKTEVDAETLEWMRKVVYGNTQIFDTQEELWKELARRASDIQGGQEKTEHAASAVETWDTSRLCLVKSTEDGITITEADGTVLYSADTFPGMKAVYKQDLDGSYVCLCGGNYVNLWQQMQDHGTGSGNAYILDDVMLWQKSVPLALILPDENCSGTRISGDGGFFDIENGTWLMKSEHVNVFNFIGYSLWTDAEPSVQRGSLRRFDGTIVTGEKQPTFVYDWFYYLTDEDQNVYDLDGHIILEGRDVNDGRQLLDIEDGFYILRIADPVDRTLIYDFDQNLIASDLSGLVYRGHYGEYLNWIWGGSYDAVMPGAESLVTNTELHTILTESEFLEKNPQYAVGLDKPVTSDTTRRDYLNISVCGATADTIEILLEDMDSYRYIICDKNFYEIYHNRTIMLNHDYTEIRYQKNGFEIRSYLDPKALESTRADTPAADDIRDAFAYIPIRRATQEELLEFQDILWTLERQEQPPYILESFMLGDTWYRMNNKYFWSEADGVCVFMENNGREWIHAILDRISGMWNTEITVSSEKVP